MIRSSVLLPLPLTPMRTMISRGATSKSTLWRTTRFPNDFEIPLTFTSGSEPVPVVIDGV